MRVAASAPTTPSFDDAQAASTHRRHGLSTWGAIYYNDVVVCVPTKPGLRVCVRGLVVATVTTCDVRLYGPSGTPTPVYRADAIDLHLPWVRPEIVALSEADALALAKVPERTDAARTRR